MDSIQQQTRIMQAAHLLFNARGYRNVTMEDLADQLGMSKKTIYQCFPGKEALAQAVVDETIARLDKVMETVQNHETDPLRGLKSILRHFQDESMWFGPLFLTDIEKFLPDLAERYRLYRLEKKRDMERKLAEAQEKGLVRKDLPIHTVTEILGVTLKALVRSDPGMARKEVLDLFLNIFCFGIAEPNTHHTASEGEHL